MAQGQSNSDFSKKQTKKNTKRLITTFTRSFGLFWTGDHGERLSHFQVTACLVALMVQKKKKIKMFALISTIIIIINNIL